MKKALFSLLLIAAISCTKEVGISGPAGPQGPAGTPGQSSANDTGTIAGKLSLYDEFSAPLKDLSGVVVSLTSGSSNWKDTTGSTGQYQFHGIKTGTYNLTYQKPAYGTMKVFGISHIAGGTVPTAVKDVFLIQMPRATAIDSLFIDYNVYNGYPYTGIGIRLDTSSLQYVQSSQNFVLFLGKNKNVGPGNYATEIGQQFEVDGNGNYYNFIDRSQFGSVFNRGDTMYCVAYTYNRTLYPYYNEAFPIDSGDAGSYVDPQTGVYVFPNLSAPSNMIKIVF